MAEGAREAEIGDPNGTHHSSCNVTAARRTERGEPYSWQREAVFSMRALQQSLLHCGCCSAGLFPLSYLIKLSPVRQSLTSH